MDSSSKHAPQWQLLTTYGLFFAFAYLVYHHLAGGEVSAFLTLSVIFHCLSVALLALQVVQKNGVRGVSAKALQLDALALCLRLSSTLWLDGYLPADLTGDWLYQAIDISTLLIVLWVMRQILVTHSQSYQADHDSLSIGPVVAVCAVLAVILHADMNSRPLFDMLWMGSLFVGVVAVLPQLWLIVKSGGHVESLMSHHIASMAVSRFLSGIFMWHAREDLTCGFWVQGFNHALYAIFAAHLLNLLLLGDFGYYYVKALVKGGITSCELELDEGYCV